MQWFQNDTDAVKCGPLLWFVVMVVGIMSAGSAMAFKVKTHIWVAQQVINELQNCREIYQTSCIRVELDGELRMLPVPTVVAEAIRDYPEFFHSGSIGPDAYPDILVGQSIIHPGVTQQNADKSETLTGFGTSDWLRDLIEAAAYHPNGEERKKVIAFVYGFLAHAAADVWAHTYVNTYAGDQFSLIDGETDVERRHIALEDYIAQKTPPIVDVDGRTLGGPDQLMSHGNSAAVPAEFVRQNLIWGRQDELQKVGTASHLRFVYDLHRELVAALRTEPSQMSNVEFAKSVGKKVADVIWADGYRTRNSDEMWKHVVERVKSYQPAGGTVQNLEIVAIQIVAYYFTGVDLSAKEAAKAAELLNQLQSAGGESVRKLNEKSQLIQTKVMDLQKLAGGWERQAVDHLTGAQTSLQGAVDRYNQLNRQLADRRQDLDRKVRDKTAILGRNLCSIASPSTCDRHIRTVTSLVREPCMKEREECIKVGGFKKCKTVKYPDFCQVSKSTREKMPEYHACLRAIDDCKVVHAQHQRDLTRASEAVTSLERQIAQISKDMQAHETAAVKGFQQLVAAASAIRDLSIRQQKAVMALEADVAQLIADITTGHRGLLNVWVTDIEEAMRQWVVANGNAIRATMDEDERTSLFGVLSEWKALYMPSILGVNQKLLNITVGRVVHVKKSYDDLWLKLESKARQVDPNVTGHVLTKRDEFMKSAPFMIAEKIDKPFSDLVGTPKYQLALTVHAVHSDISRDRFIEIFTVDTTGKKLLTYDPSGGSIADRVDADMNLVGEFFDPREFLPARNAVAFAQLALLNQKGLELLVGADRYAAAFGSEVLSNILAHSLRSIDGNHQWLEVAPPYPRRGGWAHDAAWQPSCVNRANIARRFSLPVDPYFKVSGFPLYRFYELRSEIFSKVFQVAMNQGLFKAVEFGFAQLTSDDGMVSDVCP